MKVLRLVFIGLDSPYHYGLGLQRRPSVSGYCCGLQRRRDYW